MNKEIQNIIEKTWPSQTAGVIRKTILEMENTIKEQISAVQILDAAKNISLVNKKRKISLDDEARNLR